MKTRFQIRPHYKQSLFNLEYNMKIIFRYQHQTVLATENIFNNKSVSGHFG